MGAGAVDDDPGAGLTGAVDHGLEDALVRAGGPGAGHRDGAARVRHECALELVRQLRPDLLRVPVTLLVDDAGRTIVGGVDGEGLPESHRRRGECRLGGGLAFGGDVPGSVVVDRSEHDRRVTLRSGDRRDVDPLAPEFALRGVDAVRLLGDEAVQRDRHIEGRIRSDGDDGGGGAGVCGGSCTHVLILRVGASVVTSG